MMDGPQFWPKFCFFISFFIAINVHMARNPLQIDLHLVILLPQFFYSRSCLIGIVLASSDFSTLQSFQSSLTVRKNPDFSCPYIPWWKDSFLRWDVQFSLRLTPPPLTRQGGRPPTSFTP